MKAAIMQPYFFPYLGYFSLIKHSDQFILFDTPQFIRHGWMDRNRILKPNGEPLYIRASLKKHASTTSIKDIEVNNDIEWKNKILAQIIPYRKVAPNYYTVLKLLEGIFQYQTNSLVDFNYHSIKEICKFLNINTPINIWSQMNMNIDEVSSSDEWALEICKELGVNTYFNAIGGTSFFDRDKYEKANIELNFLEFVPSVYRQFSTEFVSSLSIIDALMFCSRNQTNDMIDQFNLIS